MKPNQGDRGEVHSAKNGKVFPFLFQKTVLLVILLWPLTQTFAQSEQTPVSSTELEIGDKLPDKIWHLPLQIANHPQGKETITLNDHKGKLIVLDFWSTWCVTCIVNMPNFDELQKRFAGQLQVLPVTSEDARKIIPFMQSNPVWSKLNIASVVNDSQLKAVFPKGSLPHIVVIDKAGMIRAITVGEYLNEKAIRGLLNGDANVYIPQKRERLPKPLLAISSEYDDVNTARPLYYSTVTGFMDGMSHSVAWEPDTINGVAINRYFVSNTSIIKLYTLALGATPSPLKAQYRILEVKDPSRYVRTTSYSNISWRRKNYYIYESILPGKISKDDAKRKMKADLDLFFQVYGRHEKRVVPCLALIDIKKDKDAYRARGGEELSVSGGVVPNKNFDKVKEVGPAESGATTYIRNMEFRGLHWTFNRMVDKGLPIIINKTGFTGNFDLDLPDEPTSLAAIKLALQKQGLDLVPAKREMEMFVLTEKGYSPDPNELKFTEYGYVPKNSWK